MKDYYEILGVPHEASSAEIKQAFRRLAQLYHPDRNPDPAALKTIQEINEAYDVLGDDKQRREYDYSLSNPYVNYVPPQPRHRDPAYRGTYRPPSRPKEDPQRELMEKGLPYARGVAWTAIGVCIFLLIDFLLPTESVTETITAFQVYRTARAQSIYIVTSTGRELNIGYERTTGVSVGDNLYVRESPMLHVVRRIESEDGGLRISNLATMYTNFSFVPIVLFALALSTMVAFSLKASLDLKFNLGLVTFFILIFTVIMMLT